MCYYGIYKRCIENLIQKVFEINPALDIELITTRRYSKKSVVDLFTREEHSGESFDA